MARSPMPKHASEATPEPCVDAISRFLVIFAGLICASAGAAISMPFLAFIDPLVREAIISIFMGSLLTVFGGSSGPADAAGLLRELMRGSTLAICIAPVALAALIGELGRLRSWLWYACCSGLIAAAMPFDLHPLAEAERGEASPERAAMMLEIRFMLLFFVVGLVAGSIYWLIAGRNAGEATVELEGRAK
jgi:hypothetical protein